MQTAPHQKSTFRQHDQNGKRKTELLPTSAICSVLLDKQLHN